MCFSLSIPPSVRVTRDSGTILPGETPIQAAARRHRERKRRGEDERRKSGSSDDDPYNSSANKDTTMHEVQEVKEQTPEVSEIEARERKRRRPSWGDRWRDFRHNYRDGLGSMHHILLV